MPRYSPFSGGPAATDLSGIFAQWDTGAVARGLANAGEKVGNAITERYVQTKKEKEGAALADQYINSDMGDEILNWNKVSREEYKGLTDSAKSRLLPAFQTGLTLKTAATALAEKDFTKDSSARLNVAIEELLKPFRGTVVDKLKDLKERERYVQHFDLTSEDRKELLDRIDGMRSQFMHDLPIGVTTTGLDRDGNQVALPKGMGAFNVGGKWQVMNLPKFEDKKSPEAIFAKDLAGLEALVAAEPDNLNAQSMLKHMQESALKKVTPSGTRRIVRDPATGVVIIEELTGTEISASQKAESEKYLFAYERGVGSLDTFIDKIKPSQLGVQGQLSETLIDNFLVDWFPDNSEMKKSAGQRIKTRQAMRLWSEEVLRSVSGDTRFSVPDRNAIEEITSNPDMWTTYAKATTSMGLIRETFQRNARQKLRELGRADYPDFAKTPSMIREEVEDGTMDLIDAEQWMGRMHPDYANWLGLSLDDVLGQLKGASPDDLSDIKDRVKMMYPAKYKAKLKAQRNIK